MTRRFLWFAVPTLALTGCDMFSSEDVATPEETPTASSTATPEPSASATADAPTGGARQITEETDAFLFEYAYPQEAGDIPGLAAWLDRRMDRERSTLEREANEGREQARDNGFPFNKYSSNTTWEVVADLPGWLSLSAAFDSYQGGAHPNYGFDSIVWDRGNERAVEPASFFTSIAALDVALEGRLCAALTAERAERRGMPVDSDSGDGFDTCTSVEDATILLGSSNGEAFNRIGIQFAPYAAGPYAEGSFEFTFPVDQALLDAVKPEYRSAFTVLN